MLISLKILKFCLFLVSRLHFSLSECPLNISFMLYATTKRAPILQYQIQVSLLMKSKSGWKMSISTFSWLLMAIFASKIAPLMVLTQHLCNQIESGLNCSQCGPLIFGYGQSNSLIFYNSLPLITTGYYPGSSSIYLCSDLACTSINCKPVLLIFRLFHD